MLVPYFIFLLFLPKSFESSPNNSVAKTPDPGNEPNPAQKVSESCKLGENDLKFNTYMYGCWVSTKNRAENVSKRFENDWKMCCRVRQACQTGSKAELEECRIMFCDCLNIVVAANLALMDKTHCTADANYVECKDLAPIEKRRQDAILPYDVKFIRKFGSNLVLGTVGWSFALIVYIFGTVSLAYLVVSWIHYKCNLQLFGQSEMPIYEVETVPDEITQTTQTVQH